MDMRFDLPNLRSELGDGSFDLPTMSLELPGASFLLS